MTDVTMIGLGPMGRALAELTLGAGQTLTVWNRSTDKAAGLVGKGARSAASAAAAVAASPITIICVFDYDAAGSILDSAGMANALRDRIVINLGTGSAAEAEHMATVVERHGARYLDGAIQAAPSQMGMDDTPILISGSSSVFAEAEPVLKVFAGNLVYLGGEIGAAASMDLSTLSYVYGAFAGFMHGARMAEAAGVDVATYGALVNAISPSFGAFFEHEGGVIASGDFKATESPLRISIPAVRRILATSENLRLNTEVPALVDGWLQRAQAQGFADEEIAAVIKVLRRN